MPREPPAVYNKAIYEADMEAPTLQDYSQLHRISKMTLRSEDICISSTVDSETYIKPTNYSTFYPVLSRNFLIKSIYLLVCLIKSVYFHKFSNQVPPTPNPPKSS